MAEQKLDVRVSESGTATVVSTLEKLEKKLGDVEKAQQAETATTEKAVATLDKMSEGLAAFFDRQSSKMAVIEKAAGLLGKFNLTFELVGKAIKAGEYILDNYINKVKEFEPALDGVNKKLAIQLDLTKKLSAARGEIALLGGSAEQQQRAAALAFTIAEAEAAVKLTATEIERAQVVATRNEQAREDHARAVKQYNEEARLLQKLEGGRARAGKGPAAPVLEVAPDITTLENKGKQAAQALREASKELDALREKLKGKGPKGSGGRGAPEGQSTTAEGQTQSATEALTGGAVNLQTMGAVVTATAELQTQLDSTAASWAEVGEASLQAGADMRRAAAVSVVAAALQGKSIIKALGAVLTAKSQEYLVESLDWGLKAAGFALFGNPAAGAAAAIAAGYLAASGVAAGAGALFGGGGGGGGRGGGGGGTAPAVGATGPRAPAQADAGGPLTVNVTIDGLAISTADSIAAGVVGALQRAAETPGMRGRLNRAMGGRG